jgi:hypothetical protein
MIRLPRDMEVISDNAPMWTRTHLSSNYIEVDTRSQITDRYMLISHPPDVIWSSIP